MNTSFIRGSVILQLLNSQTLHQWNHTSCTKDADYFSGASQWSTANSALLWNASKGITFQNAFQEHLHRSSIFCRLEKQQSHGEAYCRRSAAMPKHPNLNKMGHDLSKLNNQCLGFQWYVAVRLKFQQTAYPCTVSVWRVPSGRLEKHA